MELKNIYKILNFVFEYKIISIFFGIAALLRYTSPYFQIKSQEKTKRLEIESNKELQLLKEKNRHKEFKIGLRHPPKSS